MVETIRAPCLAELPGIRHGFFTRAGGVSQGIYAGLNCGPGSADDPGHVAANRARVCEHLGAAHADIVTLYQVHGATALCIDAPVPANDRPKADAVVTRTPGLAVGVLTADCAPVLFADADARVVAAAHAGWRGAVAGILEAAIAEMERQGAQRRNIRAAVGPAINQESYEVGPEFETDLVKVARATHASSPGPMPARALTSICPATSKAAYWRQIWARSSVTAPAPTQTNRFFTASGALSTAERPITAVKSPPSSWPNCTIHKLVWSFSWRTSVGSGIGRIRSGRGGDDWLDDSSEVPVIEEFKGRKVRTPAAGRYSGYSTGERRRDDL